MDLPEVTDALLPKLYLYPKVPLLLQLLQIYGRFRPCLNIKAKVKISIE